MPVVDWTKIVKPLEMDNVWFVVHACGSFEFFAREHDAHDQAYFLGRPFHKYSKDSEEKYDEKIAIALGEFVKNEKEYHTARILAAIDTDALEAMLATARADALREAAGIAKSAMEKYAARHYNDGVAVFTKTSNAEKTYCAGEILEAILALIPETKK